MPDYAIYCVQGKIGIIKAIDSLRFIADNLLTIIAITHK